MGQGVGAMKADHAFHKSRTFHFPSPGGRGLGEEVEAVCEPPLPDHPRPNLPPQDVPSVPRGVILLPQPSLGPTPAGPIRLDKAPKFDIVFHTGD
jgi:hypothetical protein